MYGEKPFFESQIVRGKLFALCKSPTIDKERLFKVAEHGLSHKFRKYIRHRQQMVYLLNKYKYAVVEEYA